MSAGGEVWRLRCRVQGEEKLLSLGIDPAVSLADAKAARDRAESAQRSRRDPALAKRRARQRRQHLKDGRQPAIVVAFR